MSRTSFAARLRPAVFAPLAALALLPVPSSAANDLPRFDPVAFFAGRTESVGKLSRMLAGTRAIRSVGRGEAHPGGNLQLDQTVEVDGSKPQQRKWQLREISAGHYRGTLSDATGPVTADVDGSRLVIRYPMTGGMKVEAVLTLAAGGQSAHNAIKVTKFGMTVATVDETIRRT